jgi:hypothetical protein
MYSFPEPGPAGEPARDERLGALLRNAVGEAPVADVDWTALAARVGAAVRAQQAAPWWSYAARWQRRMLPMALAAGLVGALALWHSTRDGRVDPRLTGHDLVTAVVAGTSSSDAALSYAGALTSTVDLATGVPE